MPVLLIKVSLFLIFSFSSYFYCMETGNHTSQSMPVIRDIPLVFHKMLFLNSAPNFIML